MPELRKDPIVDRWVIISPERANRPLGHADLAKADCPFCPGNEAMTPPQVLAFPDDEAQASSSGWSVRVVPNKYPALVPEESGKIIEVDNYEIRSGLGAHEVIIESPRHVTDIASLSESQFEKILRAYRTRIMVLQADSRFRYILVYKNQGNEAGATLEHAHSQLIALPMIPKQAVEEITAAKAYYQANKRCIFCHLIRKETGARQRVVAENAGFIVICPFAPRFPYETWILPKKHLSSFAQDSQSKDSDLAGILRDTLIRLDRTLDSPPFNYFIHSDPTHEDENNYYHWHLEILPKLVRIGGFEWGSGSYINTVTPEESARLLREAIT
jgi:UDPglucose--hexose-1-phosphate uridylyltransferase